MGIAYKTDHCPVYVTIQSGRNPPGRGYWKFPEFLIKDAEFKSFLKGNIDALVKTNSHANPGLLWDTVKCGIRGAAMFFMKNSRSSRKEKIELTEATIAELQMLRSAYSDHSSIDEISEDIHLLNEELSSAYRSSNFEYHVGRKEADADVCSKYFLKKHFIPGSI